MSIADKLTLIAENQQKVFEAGKQAEYDKFWDSIQDNGNRTNYDFAFCYYFNIYKLFYPKYDLIPTSAQYFMREAKGNGKAVDSGADAIDLVERLNECGVKLDTSKCTNVTYLFYQARISHLPEINISSAGTTGNNLVFGGPVETIDNFIFTKEQTLKNTFNYCRRLKNIVFDGIYEAGGLGMSDCYALSKESITSIINCLSTETSGKAITLSLRAVNKAFETRENANDGSNSVEWKTLVNTKQNWTINLS